MYKIKETDKYLFAKETTSDSILADTYMWLSLLGGFWFNYAFIDGNNFLDFIILIIFWNHLVGVYKNKVKKFKTKDEFIKFLQDN